MCRLRSDDEYIIETKPFFVENITHNVRVNGPFIRMQIQGTRNIFTIIRSIKIMDIHLSDGLIRKLRSRRGCYKTERIYKYPTIKSTFPSECPFKIL